MAAILIIYATVDGHTHKICKHIQQQLEQDTHQVSLVSIADARQIDLQPFDKIVLGSSIRYGKHHPLALAFIQQQQSVLNSKTSAFFSVNIVARKAHKNTPETNPYLRRLMERIEWKPDALAVFAGKLDYPKYGPLDRSMIRLIMWITKGPTDPSSVTEFTDWAQVEQFAQHLSQL